MSAEEDKRPAGEDDGDDGAADDNEDNSIPDVVLSDAYKTLEEDEESLFKVYAIRFFSSEARKPRFWIFSFWFPQLSVA
jgi:hypothetical protein